MESKKHIILFILGIVCMAYGICTAVFTLTGTGSFVIILLGVAFLVRVLFAKQIKSLRKTKKWNVFYLVCKGGLQLFLCSLLVNTIVISSETWADPQPNADAIIVLGAGLIGEDVSLSLGSRLDTAAAYYAENPDSLIVVSGGQGENEIVSEAYAMSKYLQNTYDIPETSIMMEDKSTRTAENFSLSKALLDEYFDRDYTAIFVTNDFHVYRSEMIAELSGLDAEGLSAPSPWYLLPNYYVREFFAIIKYHLVDDPFWV